MHKFRSNENINDRFLMHVCDKMEIVQCLYFNRTAPLPWLKSKIKTEPTHKNQEVENDDERQKHCRNVIVYYVL